MARSLHGIGPARTYSPQHCLNAVYRRRTGEQLALIRKTYTQRLRVDLERFLFCFIRPVLFAVFSSFYCGGFSSIIDKTNVRGTPITQQLFLRRLNYTRVSCTYGSVDIRPFVDRNRLLGLLCVTGETHATRGTRRPFQLLPGRPRDGASSAVVIILPCASLLSLCFVHPPSPPTPHVFFP